MDALLPYAPAIAELLRPPRLAPLGPGQPNGAARARLEALADPGAFHPHSVRDVAFASACRAGLWLYHDFLDEAHAISQELDTVEGSYWHALMHRREPDFSNSKYWFRRVGTHPIYAKIRGEIARGLIAVPRQVSFLIDRAWSAEEFVDLCSSSYDETATCHDLCRQVQQVEWELLFDYCYRRATG